MDILITFFMTLVMFVGIMLVFRKPLLWYLKINEHLSNQQEIIKLLKEKQRGDKIPENSQGNKKGYHSKPHNRRTDKDNTCLN